MSKFCVATMSTTNGWATESVIEALSLHFLYWFSSRRNQGKVIADTQSFYYLWQKYGDSQENLVRETQNELRYYFAELFPEPNVLVTTTDNSIGGSSYRLNITVQVMSDGVAYDLARSVAITKESYLLLDEAHK